jgi:hypothetical protein
VSRDWERLKSDAPCPRRRRNDCEEAAPPATMATDRLKDNEREAKTWRMILKALLTLDFGISGLLYTLRASSSITMDTEARKVALKTISRGQKSKKVFRKKSTHNDNDGGKITNHRLQFLTRGIRATMTRDSRVHIIISVSRTGS